MLFWAWSLKQFYDWFASNDWVIPLLNRVWFPCDSRSLHQLLVLFCIIPSIILCYFRCCLNLNRSLIAWQSPVVVSCNQTAAITTQWWRRLVNAYELKADVCCVCSVTTVWSIPERFRGELLTMGRYTNLSYFIFLHCCAFAEPAKTSFQSSMDCECSVSREASFVELLSSFASRRRNNLSPSASIFQAHFSRIATCWICFGLNWWVSKVKLSKQSCSSTATVSTAHRLYYLLTYCASSVAHTCCAWAWGKKRPHEFQ